MSKIRLFGTSSGYVEIAPAAAASNNTLTAPSTVGEIIAKDAAGAIGVTSVHTTNVVATGTAKVGAAVTISESGIEASGIGITCANINGTQIGGRRNIIINGAMNVAQRGTTSTADGIHTVDRFKMGYGGENEVLTQAQVDVSSGTSPYAEGFRKAFKITNGNQTGGFGNGDYFQVKYTVEAQDIANSGWNYTSSSSNITLSFWIKSSVAQNFYGYLKSQDGTFRRYIFETGSLTADTWTKITKTIPGNSGITFNNDNGEGLILELIYFSGSDETGSVSLNTWATFVSSLRTPANTATWWTTNDSTLEITGVQLEVGSQATPFEHRSFGEELELCKRYYQQINGDNNDYTGFSAYSESSTSMRAVVQLHPPMRAAFTHSKSGSFRFQGATNDSGDSAYSFSLEGVNTTFNACTIRNTNYSGMGAADRPGNLQFRQDGSKLKFDAEF